MQLLLKQPSHPFGKLSVQAPTLKYLNLTLSRWQIVWQDSLLSITFDRFSSIVSAPNSNRNADTDTSSYIGAMRRLCKIGLNVVQERATARTYAQHIHHIARFRSEIDNISSNLVEHLTLAARCTSMKDQLEYWNFYMHRSYIMSELCRATIGRKRDSDRLQKDEKLLDKSLRSTCILNLSNTVEAFLGLHNVTRFAVQSWAAVHRSLSSALLLGILGEPRRDERANSLLLRLQTVMHNLQSNIDPMETSAPITRSLEALAKLMPREVPTDTFATSGFETPFAFETQELDSSSHTGSGSGPGTTPMHSFENDCNSPMSLLNSIIWGDHPAVSSSWSFDANS
jgi:hypothetical protein